MTDETISVGGDYILFKDAVTCAHGEEYNKYGNYPQTTAIRKDTIAEWVLVPPTRGGALPRIIIYAVHQWTFVYSDFDGARRALSQLNQIMFDTQENHIERVKTALKALQEKVNSMDCERKRHAQDISMLSDKIDTVQKELSCCVHLVPFIG